MERILLAGFCDAISFGANGLGVALEAGAGRFPTAFYVDRAVNPDR